MAKIKQQPPREPVFPWGGRWSVRDRLVDPSQFERVRKNGRKADPRNPALPSAALMDFIGPAHSAEEMRLPMPPQPRGHGAELSAFSDRAHLQAAVERGSEESSVALERALQGVSPSPQRMREIEALLGREARMIERLAQLREELEEILCRMREEQKERGY
jgi:hypothetical protein